MSYKTSAQSTEDEPIGSELESSIVNVKPTPVKGRAKSSKSASSSKKGKVCKPEVDVIDEELNKEDSRSPKVQEAMANTGMREIETEGERIQVSTAAEVLNVTEVQPQASMDTSNCFNSIAQTTTSEASECASILDNESYSDKNEGGELNAIVNASAVKLSQKNIKSGKANRNSDGTAAENKGDINSSKPTTSISIPIISQQMCQTIFVEDNEAIKVLFSLGFGVKQLSKVSTSTMEIDEDFNAVKKSIYINKPLDVSSQYIPVLPVAIDSPALLLTSNSMEFDEDEVNLLIDAFKDPAPQASNNPAINSEDVDPEPISQPLLLSDEEAFFLATKGIIIVNKSDCAEVAGDGHNTYSLQDLWTMFCAKTPNFPYKYKTYEYFKSKGHVVKGGINYGVDFTVYRTLPVWCHSEVCVIVIAADPNEDTDDSESESESDCDSANDSRAGALCRSGSSENKNDSNNSSNSNTNGDTSNGAEKLEVGELVMSWRHLSAMTRITPDVMKLFILAYCYFEPDAEGSDVDPTDIQFSNKLKIKLLAMNNRRKNCLNEKYQSLLDIHTKYQSKSLLKRPRKVKSVNTNPTPKPSKPKPIPPEIIPMTSVVDGVNSADSITDSRSNLTLGSEAKPTPNNNSNSKSKTKHPSAQLTNKLGVVTKTTSTGVSIVGGRRDIFQVRTKGNSKNNKLWKSLLESDPNDKDKDKGKLGQKRIRDNNDTATAHCDNSGSNIGNDSRENKKNKKAKVNVNASGSESNPSLSPSFEQDSGTTQNMKKETLVNSAKAVMAAHKAKLEEKKRHEEQQRLVNSQQIDSQSSPTLPPVASMTHESKKESIVNSAKAVMAAHKAKLEEKKRLEEQQKLLLQSQ